MQKQCVRDGKGWQCPDMASPGSVYCHKHHMERDAYNQKRRKTTKTQTRYVTHLPSGDLRCRRTGKQWQCHDKATSGLYCHKHGLMVQIRDKKRRKGPPRPNRALMTLLSLDQGQSNNSGIEGSIIGQLTSEENRDNNVEHVITNPNTNDGVQQVTSGQVESGEPTMQQQCHQGGKTRECLEMASPGMLYCDSHQLEWDASNKMTRKGPKKQSPGGEQCRRAGKGWRCEEIASPGIYCETHQLERNISNDQRRKKPKKSNKDVRGSNTRDALSEPNSNDYGKEVSSGAVKPGRETTKRHGDRNRLRNKETISVDLVSGLGEITMKKCRGVLVNDEQKESGWVGTQNTASPDNQLTCDQLQNAIDDKQNDAIMLPFWSDYNSHEELQEIEGLSVVTDGAMKAVDYSCEQMEAEKDIMEVLAGVQSTVYVGDIPIPAEYEQIYKEIKDLHGPLENGESVGEKRSLSHATLVELLKVAHELEGLTMESMTETTISNFEKTVAVGKLFNYNVGWLDENLKRLSDLYAKCCAVGGELEQVEKKIIGKKHEEDILELEIDESIRVHEESINSLKQKREMIEMEKKKTYSNVSSLQERILETSERICDT